MTMQLMTYLTFDGTCREAFTFYAKVLDGRVTTMMTHGDSPMADQTTPELRDKVMHAELTVGDQMLFGTDGMGPYRKPQGFSVTIAIDDVARAQRIFQALSEGGEVRMPFEETFWAKGFGDLVDRFGTPWMISAGDKR
jgi:PhnB protein